MPTAVALKLIISRNIVARPAHVRGNRCVRGGERISGAFRLFFHGMNWLLNGREGDSCGSSVAAESIRLVTATEESALVVME